MRVAALYDIHGNLPALEAVLEDIRETEVDLIVIGGDVVPGPMPLETFELLLNLDIPVQFIMGNGDREVLTEMEGKHSSTLPEEVQKIIRHSAQQLLPEHKKLIATWPKTLRAEISGLSEVLFCHATPQNDTEIFTRLTPEEKLLPIFNGVNESLVICGHTHMQFDRIVGKARVVNAGSVGMPFQEPGAYWLLLGPDVQLRHTTYDLIQAGDRIRNTNYPQAEEFAINNVLQPPSEQKTLETFTKVELK